MAALKRELRYPRVPTQTLTRCILRHIARVTTSGEEKNIAWLPAILWRTLKPGHWFSNATFLYRRIEGTFIS